MGAGYTELREGDVIHVRMVVCEAKQLVKAKLAAGDIHFVARDEIVHVEPRPLQAGDKVRLKTEASLAGTIVHVDDGMAWVRSVDRPSWLFKLTELERVP